jgi:prepilin-type processing-associated H-X9-DG protein
MIGRKVYLLNDDADPSPLNRRPPFGYPLAPDEAPPLKITAFDNYLPASSVFAISDLDQSHPKLNPAIGWFNELDGITKPVHGMVRNNLFFDWHVEAVRQ